MYIYIYNINIYIYIYMHICNARKQDSTVTEASTLKPSITDYIVLCIAGTLPKKYKIIILYETIITIIIMITIIIIVTTIIIIIV